MFKKIAATVLLILTISFLIAPFYVQEVKANYNLNSGIVAAVNNMFTNVQTKAIEGVYLNGSYRAAATGTNYNPGGGNGYVEFRSGTFTTTAVNNGLVMFSIKLYYNFTFNNLDKIMVASNKSNGNYHEILYYYTQNDYLQVIYAPSITELQSSTVKFYLRFYYKNNVSNDYFSLGNTNFLMYTMVNSTIPAMQLIYTIRLVNLVERLNVTGGSTGNVDLSYIENLVSNIENLNESQLTELNNIYDYLVNINSGILEVIEQQTYTNQILQQLIDTMPTNENSTVQDDLIDGGIALNEKVDEVEVFVDNYLTELDTYDNLIDLTTQDFNFLDVIINTNDFYKNYLDNVYVSLGNYRAFIIVPVIGMILLFILGLH